mmetsp:Transcript_10561/g.17217  ORF Transcript_10561/g.17217 Transcript_10561/m.17217 type:complete len:257 (-) Transcript_10561:46-816(-)
MQVTKVSVKELNALLTCPICDGYYREAHTILECMHTFCKACILKHFHNNNNRGTISCPKCSINLGIYGQQINHKMLYDRDLQSIVDKIFPQFLTQEKEEEEEFYALNSIPRKAAGVEANNDKQSRKRPREAPEAELAVPTQSIHQQDKELNTENKFRAILTPCADCHDKLRLPPVERPYCKASFNVSIQKVKAYLHRRFPGSLQEKWTERDIEILFDNEVLEEGRKLEYIQSKLQSAIDAKNVEFVYRLRQADSRA